MRKKGRFEIEMFCKTVKFLVSGTTKIDWLVYNMLPGFTFWIYGNTKHTKDELSVVLLKWPKTDTI